MISSVRSSWLLRAIVMITCKWSQCSRRHLAPKLSCASVNSFALAKPGATRISCYRGRSRLHPARNAARNPNTASVDSISSKIVTPRFSSKRNPRFLARSTTTLTGLITHTSRILDLPAPKMQTQSSMSSEKVSEFLIGSTDRARRKRVIIRKSNLITFMMVACLLPA